MEVAGIIAIVFGAPGSLSMSLGVHTIPGSKRMISIVPQTTELSALAV